MIELNFKSFDIGEEILKALEKLKYNKPSEVQKQAIPLALQGKDIIVKSQTGSGKTGAFAIPICEKVEIEENKLQALVLTPTRELAIQVKEDINSIGRFKRVRSAAVFGKQPISDQIRELKQRVHVVVGTPGRTLDHLKRGTIDIEGVKYLIIDEADEMLNMGFIEQVEGIIDYLPKNRVTMLFSATIPEEIESLCHKYMFDPENIEINSKNLTVEKIKQIYYEVESNKKFSLLKNLIYTERPDSCIIFCNLKDTVESLTQRMQSRDYSCSKLHGGMLQKDRIDMMESFKRGEFRFLVATDVAARGIDVENVTHVINYDIPMEKESYVHRIGRTGRAGKEGIAITFVASQEYRFLHEIEEYIGLSIEEGKLPSEEELEKGRKIFKETGEIKHIPKKKKGSELDKEIMKIYINAGKKKKIRAGDIVGAITNIKGVNAENIGVIDIQNNFSYVDILDGKGNLVINALEQTTIKGKNVKVQKAVK